MQRIMIPRKNVKKHQQQFGSVNKNENVNKKKYKKLYVGIRNF